MPTGTFSRSLSVLAGVLLFAGCAGETTGPPLQPTATVQELMAHMIDPAADVFWDAVGTIITEDSVDHWEPRTEEEWTVIRHAALTLTEAGNLLMIGDRARDQDAWMRMVQGMTDSGHKALQAVDAKDAEAVFAVGEDVYNACNNCHNLYWVGDEDRGRVRD